MVCRPSSSKVVAIVWDTTPTLALAELESQTASWTVDVNMPNETQIKNIAGSFENDLATQANNWLLSGDDYWISYFEPEMNLHYYVTKTIVIFTDGTRHPHYVRPVITVPKTQIAS